jgi:hypothetical protein
MATEPSAQVDELRRRIAELERELAEQTARANAAIAAAEDRSYWLDRMRIDLNAVMRNRVAHGLFSLVQFGARAWRAAKWRLRGQ